MIRHRTAERIDDRLFFFFLFSNCIYLFIESCLEKKGRIIHSNDLTWCRYFEAASTFLFCQILWQPRHDDVNRLSNVAWWVSFRLFSFLVTWDECFTYLDVVVCLFVVQLSSPSSSFSWLDLVLLPVVQQPQGICRLILIPRPPSETQNPPVRRRRTQSDGQIYLTTMIMMCRTCGWRVFQLLDAGGEIHLDWQWHRRGWYRNTSRFTHRDRMGFEFSFVFLMSSKFEKRTVELRKSFRDHPSVWGMMVKQLFLSFFF